MEFNDHIGTMQIFSQDFCDKVLDLYDDLDRMGLCHAGRLGNKKGRVNRYEKDGKEVVMNMGVLKETQELTTTGYPILEDFFAGLWDGLNEYGKKYHAVDPNEAKISPKAMKVQKYAIGGGYHNFHCEQGDRATSDRLMAYMVYLTTHEGSGETEFLYQGHKEQAVAGKLVLWPGSYTHIHRGNPSYDKEKAIITGWITWDE